ncbi:RAMP superfamily CRISPR-associated protein, partial [Thermovibrio sp.]
TNVPKIPGSSLAGTWRYYVALKAISEIKEEVKEHIDKIIKSLDGIEDNERERLKEKKESLSTAGFNELKKSIYKILGIENNDNTDREKKEKIHQSLKEYFKEEFRFDKNGNWKFFEGNRFLQITCAGQDNVPQEELSNSPFATNEKGKTGHCGHCIVCKGFGFSKRDISWQGMIFFSDLQILFFPVFTIKGTKWITTASRLREIGISIDDPSGNKIKTKEGNEGHLNLGWLYLEVQEGEGHNLEDEKLKDLSFNGFNLGAQDIVIVPESLFSHIVNSSLEVRTSVSIDPITGAAKEGALFTSEAIPRGTIFYGTIRILNRKAFGEIESKLEPLPDVNQLKKALEDSKHFYETLGIGGMTTRGFGRLKITSPEWENKDAQNKSEEVGNESNH